MTARMEHAHKMIAGVCLIVAPLLLLAEIVIDPMTDTSNEEVMLRDTAAHPDRFYVATLVSCAAMVAFVPATLGLMHMLRERSPRLALAGGGLALLGVLALLSLFIGSSLVQREMVEGNADPGQMAALLDRFGNSGRVAPFFLLVLTWPLGLLLLAAGLYRARTAYRMAAPLIVISAVLFVLVGAGDTGVLITRAVMLVGFGSIGLQLLRESDADWEHQPELRRFRAAAGAT